MDESVLLLNRLLSAATDRRLDAAMTESDFHQLLLYWLAARLIDWDGFTWRSVVERSPWSDAKNTETRVRVLMHHCGRHTQLSTRKHLDPKAFSQLLDEHLNRLEYDERVAVFDSLFYRIASANGINRHHAHVSAALTNGLARKGGLIDLACTTGEPFIVHHRLDIGRTRYGALKRDVDTRDLLHLRFAVHQIELQVMEEKRQDFDQNSLTFVDLREADVQAFTELSNRLGKYNFSERMLVLFKPGNGSERLVPKLLSGRLLNDDLLEAVFTFTSHDVRGKPSRFCGWLLNGDKMNQRETVCINTRHLLDAVQSVTTEQLAWFAAAVCELWASPVKFRFGQFPQERLGPLRGLFSQHFSEGYQDIDGLCRVLPLERAMRGLTTGRHIPPPVTTLSEHSLLDKNALLKLFDDQGTAPFCAYIIGNNGAGKSLLLSSMAMLLPQRLRICTAIASSHTDRFPLTSKKPYYRYLGNRSSRGSPTQRIEQRLLDLLAEAYAVKHRGPLFESLLEPLGLKNRLYLLPRSVLHSSFTMDVHLRGQPLEEVLHDRMPPKGMTLALSWQNNERLVAFDQLSSGEQQMLLLLGKIVACADSGSVLLIDEPEISLHVHWQQLLPGLFSRIAEHTGAQFLIATHSPTLVANAQDNLSHCFLAKDGALEPISADQRHSVETILLEGFETYTPHNREVAERCAALVAQAIRATNRDEHDSLAEKQASLLEELHNMATVMDNSGITEDTRYRQDLELIGQAKRAIVETFTLAREEAVT